MDKYAFYEGFSDYEQVRGSLMCRLLSEKNARERYGDMPSRSWLDLRLCCYCGVEDGDFSFSSVPVEDSLLSLWHVDADTVLADAWENTKEQKDVVFCLLDQYIQLLCEETGHMDMPPFFEGPPLYLLTNPDRIFGAVYMAVPGVMRQVGRKLGRDFYIIPSSIHECLILPYTDMIELNELNAMVRAVNSEVVAKQEVLADHVYFYDRVTESVRICSG